MLVVLDNIRSVHNVGSIFRTADALGVKKIFCCGVTPTPLDRFGKPVLQFVKVSLGAEKSIAWEKKKTALGAVKELKKMGYTIVAIEQAKKSVPYFKMDLKKKSFSTIAFVLGSEVNGISQSVLRLSDDILEIPMNGKKESLNVAISFGIVGFHLRYN